MANLNIPFVLFQPFLCQIKLNPETSQLIPYHKYNFKKSDLQQNYYDHHFSQNLQQSQSQKLQQDNIGAHDKLSSFDDTPKNLLVVGDEESGTIILCHEEHYLSSKYQNNDQNESKYVNKYIVSIIPRVLLVPSISEEVGALVDHTLVRSPAQHILSTSSYFLVTLHSDNRIRLWNTNDGRCVMISSKDLFINKVHKIKTIQMHPGHIIAISKDGEIYIVNVYTMHLKKHLKYDYQGFTKCLFRKQNFILCDEMGKIHIWKDESEPSPVKNEGEQKNSILLELCNNDSEEAFQFQLEQVAGGSNNMDQKILTFNYINQDLIIVVGSKRIDLIRNQIQKTVYTFTHQVIFAKFVINDERDILIVIDDALNLMIIDTMKLKFESVSNYQILSLNLLHDSKLFGVQAKSDEINPMINDIEEIKQKSIEEIGRTLLKNISQGKSPFKYSTQESLIYSIIEVNKVHKVISWSLETIIENINNVKDLKNQKIPLFSNQFTLFQKQGNNCLINFNSLIIRNLYNKNQFQFFFSDETITQSVTYMSSDRPSLIIGTNYGRIFIISMFQENEEKINPVVLIDSHHQSPITQMFITYNSSRKPKQSIRSSITQLTSPQSIQYSYDTGGHLISVSENGTIAVTNLNSGEIHKQIHNFSIVNERDKKRIDAFMQERNTNQREKRRNSFHQHFTVNQYFYLVHAKSQKIYDNATFSQITKICEVKNINEIQNKIIAKRRKKSQNLSYTPEARREEGEFNRYQQKEGGGSVKAYESEEVTTISNYPPLYACISEDGMVIILQITNLQVDIQCYIAMDSQVIGVYQDQDMQMIYFLTENLSFYAFNKKSKTLVRKSDFKFGNFLSFQFIVAISVLSVKESVHHILAKIQSFKQQSQNDNILDFYSFQKAFKHKNILMGLGSHKTLDYLSLSLNMPMLYHPQTVYTNKHTKAIHDLLKIKSKFHDFDKNEDSQKAILRELNETFFMNNTLYKSDFNQYYFQKQSGVTSLETKKTICKSQQHMFIINTKQMIKVLRHKMQKSTSQFGKQRLSKHGPIDDNQEFLLEEEKSSPSQIQPKLSLSYRNSSHYRPEIEALSKLQWPTRLLSLVHPFNIDEQVDLLLEQFLGLNLPFLDFRVGIQGIDESFSFIITKEDEDFHSDRQNLQKILRLLKISAEEKKNMREGSNHQMQFEQMKVGLDQIVQDGQHIDNEPLGRFFNSEYWKISSYLSTIAPTLLLSVLVSIIEFAQNDIKFLLQEWLFMLQKINRQRTINNSNEISMAVISKILLKKDHNISSTARDIIMKPILYYLDIGYLKASMDEWQDLIIDTYKKLRQEQNMKKTYGGQQQIKSEPSSGIGSIASTLSSKFNGQIAQNVQGQQETQQINQFFGDLEIRGLINISYYTLYFSQFVDHQIQYRVSKITTILTREIVQKFHHDKKYIHLLTTLLQLLSTWMKTQKLTSKSKIIIDQVIKLLLILFNIYKAPLNKEQFITRVAAVNYHLIRPMHTELYLKLTAAKALLEIGENFTHDFLMIMQDQATTLNEGADYQQNVLEILRYFINSYGENLEHHLIQLTQILLKCLDPNDLALRKNSHKIISVILSTMVKIFPMVAFHHESQRLAVGTHDGPIAIYDVRTSAKWKILEGHSGNVTCLTFDSKGNLLASYSAVDLTVRLWKVGNTGFFSTIMGGTGKCSKEIKLDSIQNVKNPHQLIQQQKQQSQLNRQANIMGSSLPEQEASKTGGDGTKINKCSIQFIKPKEKEVELIREDGSKTTHKLVK